MPLGGFYLLLSGNIFFVRVELLGLSIEYSPINNDSQFLNRISSRVSLVGLWKTPSPAEKVREVAILFRILYYRKGADVWIGLERDFSAPTLSFKWIDGSTLTYASFGDHPWRSANIPSIDKACVMLDWGGKNMKFEPHECSAPKDFLCEGTCIHVHVFWLKFLTPLF